MNVRAKTLIVLFIIFIAGVTVGALINGALRRQHIDEIGRLREPRRFVGFTEQILQPTEAQRDTIQKILIENHQQMLDLSDRHMKELTGLMDSLHQRLAPILTKDQMERLTQFEKRMHPRKWEGFGPPPPGGPMPPMWQSGLKERLKLTEAQNDKLSKIFSEEKSRFSYHPDRPREHQRSEPMAIPNQRMKYDMISRINEVLTPEQQKEFEIILKEGPGPVSPPMPPTDGPGGPPPDRL